MTDEELAEKAEQYHELDARIKRLEGRKDRIKADILKEMQKRKTEGIVTHGLKITYVQQKPISYDPVRLKKSIGAVLFKECLTEVLDKSKVLALVQEGKVSLTKVERASYVEPRAPYILVNPAEK